MDKRLIFLIVGILLLASVVLVLKKCRNSEKLSKATITVTPRSIKEGDNISYSDQTPGATRWKWDFGDGETSLSNSGTHSYVTAGTYKIMVEVYGGFGKVVDSEVTINVASRISNMPPAVFAIEGPTTVIAGEKVTFVCNTPNVVRYLWRSAETGHMDTTKKATFQFSSPGTTQINLHVVMADNSTGDKQVEVTVRHKPLPAGVKPPPKKPTAEIEAGIMKTLLAILNAAATGDDMPADYGNMIKQYFCDNEQIPVTINSTKKKDINAYCTALLLNKDIKISSVKVTTGPDNCVLNVEVTQK